MLFGNGGVEAFCNGVHNVDVIHRHHNGFTQVMVSFYVRGNADLMYNVGDDNLKVGVALIFRNGGTY